ncbi:hypothetical protein NEIMUCOT_04055 [Neisseria mucosa ATCC 25996]|uniref:Uncharacterized protein n=1 Tax=Neisseria mucosa (strain ATCC 25996 / DSM 4631 / NCTC 10774 / M26) TaxID=546266 RepID=D2ZTW7_NEIM2|nr:hypothetical protein NEIMUCOT_04055 [Neisseria mucosa ATCC 25996]
MTAEPFCSGLPCIADFIGFMLHCQRWAFPFYSHIKTAYLKDTLFSSLLSHH